MEFFPCSPKMSQDVPLNSLLLNSHVSRNSTACSLDSKKYSSMFPKFQTYFSFWWLFIFVSFTSPFIVEIIIQPQQNTCFVFLMIVALLLILLEWRHHMSVEFHPEIESDLPLKVPKHLYYACRTSLKTQIMLSFSMSFSNKDFGHLF